MVPVAFMALLSPLLSSPWGWSPGLGAERRPRVVPGGAACCLLICPASGGLGPKPCAACLLASCLWTPTAASSCSKYTPGIDLQTEYVGHIFLSSSLSKIILFLDLLRDPPNSLFLNSHLNVVTLPSETRISYDLCSTVFVHIQSLEMLETFSEESGSEIALPTLVCQRKGRRKRKESRGRERGVLTFPNPETFKC